MAGNADSLRALGVVCQRWIVSRDATRTELERRLVLAEEALIVAGVELYRAEAEKELAETRVTIAEDETVSAASARVLTQHRYRTARRIADALACRLQGEEAWSHKADDAISQIASLVDRRRLSRDELVSSIQAVLMRLPVRPLTVDPLPESSSEESAIGQVVPPLPGQRNLRRRVVRAAD